MASKIRVDINSAGAQSILKSSEVQAELLRRARLIAAAAGDGMESNAFMGKTRARASVITATVKARRSEATDRSLTKAIDAGRG